jgi:hypothetical protein
MVLTNYGGVTMVNNVEYFINTLLKKENGKNKKVSAERYTVSIDGLLFKRLMFMCNKFNMNRSEFTSQCIDSIVSDLEDKLLLSENKNYQEMINDPNAPLKLENLVTVFADDMVETANGAFMFKADYDELGEEQEQEEDQVGEVTYL